MKLKEGFIITKNGNDYIAVAAGEAGKAFNGMIKMNGTAGFIATLLAESDTTAEKVTDAVCEKYEVKRDVALENVLKVIDTLRKQGLVEE